MAVSKNNAIAKATEFDPERFLKERAAMGWGDFLHIDADETRQWCATHADHVSEEEATRNELLMLELAATRMDSHDFMTLWRITGRSCGTSTHQGLTPKFR